MTVVVRTATDPLALASTIRGELKQLDPELQWLASPRCKACCPIPVARALYHAIARIFAAIALLLAAVGIYA